MTGVPDVCSSDLDENAQGMTSIPYSTEGKPGIGDVYIWDMVRLESPAQAGTASFQFTPEGTWYWHER